MAARAVIGHPTFGLGSGGVPWPRVGKPGLEGVVWSYRARFWFSLSLVYRLGLWFVYWLVLRRRRQQKLDPTSDTATLTYRGGAADGLGTVRAR